MAAIKKKKPLPEEETPKPTPAPMSTPTADFPTPKRQTPIGRSGAKFNTGGSVDYNVGGQAFALTPEEYKSVLNLQGSNSSGGSVITPNVQAIINLERGKQAGFKTEEELASAQELIAAPQTEADFPTFENVIPSAEALLQQGTAKTNEELGKNRLLPTQIQNFPLLKTATASAVDKIRIAISGKRPLAEQISVETFTEAKTALQSEIDSVREGRESYISAYTSMQDMAGAIARLEAHQKMLGQENLRGWIDGGIELEVQIKNMKTMLFEMRVDLIQARGEAIQNKLAQQQATIAQVQGANLL